MTVSYLTGKPFPRGARRSPPHRLQMQEPHRIVRATPDQFAGLATTLNMEGNDQYGDCVTAEEAEAKSAWSQGYCGLPELIVPASVAIAWAKEYGYLNGADLTSVLDTMQQKGMVINGTTYFDGPNSGVDYTNQATLNNAIYTGPVKIAIAADCLPSGAGNATGWYSLTRINNNNTDHCVGLRAFGRADFCYDAMKVSLPSAVPAATLGFVLYTWATYGFVTFDWIQGTCAEAHVRNPTTPGQTPAPTPNPTPSPVPWVPLGSATYPAALPVGSPLSIPIPSSPVAIPAGGIVAAYLTNPPSSN